MASDLVLSRREGIHADCWYCHKPGFLYRHSDGYNISMCDACRDADVAQALQEDEPRCTCWIGRGEHGGSDREGCVLHRESAIKASDAALVPRLLKEKQMTETIWYGPHACQSCGVTIVKAAREQGGAEFEPPARLMQVYHRGSEAQQVDLVYPQVWAPHICDAAAVERWKTLATPSAMPPEESPRELQ
jgi:hypothetical protein